MAPQQDQDQPPMDAARRRIRAVSAHLSPPAPAAGSGLDANPTAGEYAHGTSPPLPAFRFTCCCPAGTPVLPSRVAMPPTWNPRCGRWELDGPLLRRVASCPAPTPKWWWGCGAVVQVRP